MLYIHILGVDMSLIIVTFVTWI